MSSLIVRVHKIESIKEHPNADRLEIAVIEGWESIIQKGQYKAGDLVTFVPPDAQLPDQLIEQYGLRQYLRGANHTRVGVAKLRGVMSYGLVLPAGQCSEGEDVADLMGITKYEPPIRTVQGQAEPEDLTFPHYIDIENFKNFKTAFQPGEEVVVTEKIDGSNSRVGMQVNMGVFTLKAGSHRVNRKDPGEELWAKTTYWFPHSLQCIQDCLHYCWEGSLKDSDNHVTIYGELYGSIRGGVKSMDYGCSCCLQYRAFGVMYNHQWKTPEHFFAMCDEFGIPTVPILYRGPFDLELITKLLDTPSVVAAEQGKTQIKEGVVIQSATCPIKILKLINPEYLLAKNKAEDKGETFDVEDI